MRVSHRNDRKSCENFRRKQTKQVSIGRMGPRTIEVPISEITINCQDDVVQRMGHSGCMNQWAQ